MDYLDIACIVFACTAANHLGLTRSIQLVLKWNKLPVVGCIKCLTFWAVLIYCCCRSATRSITDAIEMAPVVLAISFLSAWASIWLDLGMGMIDKLYLKIYDTLYPTADAADTDEVGADDTMPDVPK